MKYMKAQVQVPYFDDTGAKQWLAININSPIDHRRLLRGVRKFVKDNFNKRVSNDWVKMHCIITYPVVKQRGIFAGGQAIVMDEVVHESKEQQRKRMDDIYMMFVKDEDENQDGAYPEVEDADPQEAGKSL